MTIAALITAAGSGTRFGARKQFLDLVPGLRLVDAAVETCRQVADWVGVLVPADHTWEGPPVDLVAVGGDSRQATLLRGLAALPSGADRVLIHSASHPLATVGLAAAAVAALDDGADAAVPLWTPADVIKDGRGTGLVTVGREGFGLAQSPMAFRRHAIVEAFAAGREAVEESALVEADGGVVRAVPGEVTNVHVIDPLTLDMARALLPVLAAGAPTGRTQ
ncbi:MAG: 2-C-methyl-D-erythritol 4-phosphate cytidylyltransferase [Actinomycetota bacterium]